MISKSISGYYFIEIVNKFKCRPNKLWVDQGRELYNNPMQKWLDDNILMHSTYNEGKSVVSEKFKKTLKGKMVVNLILVISLN